MYFTWHKGLDRFCLLHQGPFRTTSRQLFLELCVNIRMKLFAPAEYIITQGVPVEGMYFIWRGVVRIFVLEHAVQKKIDYYSCGNFVGMEGLFAPSSAVFGVRNALTEDFCELMHLSRAAFNDVLATCPEWQHFIDLIRDGVGRSEIDLMQLATAGAPPAFEEAHARLERELELEHAMQQGRGKKKKNRRLSQVAASPSTRLEPTFVVSEIAPLRSTIDQLLHEVRQLASDMARHNGWSGSQQHMDDQRSGDQRAFVKRTESRSASDEDTNFQILRALQASLDRESKQEELMLRLSHSNDQLSKKVDVLSQQLAQHGPATHTTRAPAATPLVQPDVTAQSQPWVKTGWSQCCAPTSGSGPAVLTLEADDSAAKWSLVT